MVFSFSAESEIDLYLTLRNRSPDGFGVGSGSLSVRRCRGGRQSQEQSILIAAPIISKSSLLALFCSPYFFSLLSSFAESGALTRREPSFIQSLDKP